MRYRAEIFRKCFFHCHKQMVKIWKIFDDMRNGALLNLVGMTPYRIIFWSKFGRNFDMAPYKDLASVSNLLGISYYRPPLQLLESYRQSKPSKETIPLVSYDSWPMKWLISLVCLVHATLSFNMIVKYKMMVCQGSN